MQDSNLRPIGYEPIELATALTRDVVTRLQSQATTINSAWTCRLRVQRYEFYFYIIASLHYFFITLLHFNIISLLHYRVIMFSHLRIFASSLFLHIHIFTSLHLYIIFPLHYHIFTLSHKKKNLPRFTTEEILKLLATD